MYEIFVLKRTHTRHVYYHRYHFIVVVIIFIFIWHYMGANTVDPREMFDRLRESRGQEGRVSKSEKGRLRP